MAIPPPIFILSAACSGSSLLSAMLGQHPQLYGVPEINLLMMETTEQMVLLLQGPRHFQAHGLMRLIAQLYTGEQTINAIAMSRRWLSNRYYAPTPEVYAELCGRIAPLRVVDPSTLYAARRDRLERLFTAFPEAFFIHLVRHPRSQGEALMAIGEGALAISDGGIDFREKNAVIDPQYSWYRFNANIGRFLAEVPASQQMRVSLEQLVEAPLPTLEKLCRALALDWNTRIAAELLQPERSSYAEFGPYSSQLGHDPHFLRDPHVPKAPLPRVSLDGVLHWRNDEQGFLPEVQELARKLGYS